MLGWYKYTYPFIDNQHHDMFNVADEDHLYGLIFVWVPFVGVEE